jgi:hypothetical protein
MFVPAFLTVNGGIPTLSSNSVVVGTTAVSFDFTNHRNVGRPYRGLVIIRLAQEIPAGTTDTLPIQFTSAGNNAQPVTTFNGAAVTVARLATIDQTAVLAGKLDAQTALIQDKFCALEMREMQNKIDALRDEKLALQTNISQRAQNEYIATSLYPISTALTELRADFDCFKSHLPETVSVPYSPVTAVPNCVAYQYGFGPYGPFVPGNGSF